MLKRDLPGTDLTISVIGLGCWAIGGAMWGPQDDADSIAAIHAAVDGGVNWIDTAPIYGSGHSEVMVGKALAGLDAARRPAIFTKFGLGDSLSKRVKSATTAEVIAECDASLKRLGIERIDLYQLHWPVDQSMDEVAGACDTLLQAGKIAAVGVCNYSVAEIDAWRATGKPLHCLQTPYSLFRPASGETILPHCFDSGMGGLAYSPLFRGMLFGAWTADKTFAADDTRGQHKDYRGKRFARHLQAIEALKVLADEDDLSVPQLCIAALLGTPGLTGCIVGARNAAQGAALAELPAILKAKQLAAVEEICAALVTDLAGIPEEPAG